MVSCGGAGKAGRHDLAGELERPHNDGQADDAQLDANLGLGLRGVEQDMDVRVLQVRGTSPKESESPGTVFFWCAGVSRTISFSGVPGRVRACTSMGGAGPSVNWSK